MLRGLVVVVAFTVGLPCSAYELRKDASGASVRWRDHVEFVIDRKLPATLHEPKAEEAVRAAVQTVAAAAGVLQVSVRVGDSQGMGYDVGNPSKNQNEITALEDWPYQDEALAVTIVTLNGRTHEVLDADIAFNADQRHFRALPAQGGSHERDQHFDDVQNTLTHELGHALGLMHNLADEQVVMYPSAPPGEIQKRVLAADDRAGLTALYQLPEATPAAPATPTAPAPPPVGCSSTSAAPSLWPVLVALGLFLVSRRRAAIALVALPALALAGPPLQPEPDLTRTAAVSIGEVVASRTLHAESNPRLLVTELEIEVRSCLGSPCAPRVVVVVPGGKLGDLEQEVADHPVPAPGTTLAVFPARGRARVFRLDTPADWGRLGAAARKAGLVVARSPQTLPTPVSRP